MGVLKWAEMNNVNVFDTANFNIGKLLDMKHSWWQHRSIAHLACHLGYFDRAYVDARIDAYTVANALGLGAPPQGQPVCTLEQMYQYVRDWNTSRIFCLDEYPPALVEPPGPQSAIIYDGFGIARLADVISTGGPNGVVPYKSYEDWMQEHLFSPLGLTRPRLGVQKARDARSRAHEEVLYHMSPPSVYKSVYDAVVEDGELAPAKVAPVNYEGHAYNLGLPAGQWSMSAADYVRLLMSLDVPGELLNAAHIQEITQTSFAQSWTLGFYAPALPAVMSNKRGLIEHNGTWPTTAAVAFRRSDGLTATLLMNCNFPGGLGASNVEDMIALLSFDDSLWPTEDLFPDAL